MFTLNACPKPSLDTAQKCGCGCGTVVNKRFVSGHNNIRNPNFIYEDGRAYEQLVCEECSFKFKRRADVKSPWKLCKSCNGKRNGSNRIGKILSNRKGEYLVCKVCEKTYYVSRNRIMSKFCSKPCLGKYQQEQPLPKGFITGTDNAGEKNGRYKHGKRIGGHISKKKVREAVIERDGNWCLRCGKAGPGLHLHRVEYGSQCGKYETANCVLLCNVHHELIHSNKKYWQPVLFQHLAVGDKP